jgi:hypothetical protein
MYTYLRDGTVTSTTTATSVASDGSSAEFPYPRQLNGAMLARIYRHGDTENSRDRKTKKKGRRFDLRRPGLVEQLCFLEPVP